MSVFVKIAAFTDKGNEAEVPETPAAVTSIYISNELRVASTQIAAKRNRKRKKHGDFSRLAGTATESEGHIGFIFIFCTMIEVNYAKTVSGRCPCERII
ncbi:hypothetical protein EBO34_14785 [Alteribacter keqinensis]|uniref:Uncharacterized protein n=1 Tax=Alteribacter keqinensis TaxID=2483800 RepID=A0A3M7TQN6_9BACI|nr:hypothetical protein EBO34_14785 [Alteribacter keqinensis]